MLETVGGAGTAAERARVSQLSRSQWRQARRAVDMRKCVFCIFLVRLWLVVYDLSHSVCRRRLSFVASCFTSRVLCSKKLDSISRKTSSEALFLCVASRKWITDVFISGVDDFARLLLGTLLVLF